MSDRRLSSNPASISTFSGKSVIIILLLVTICLYFIISSLFSRDGDETYKHLVPNMKQNDLQFLENHDLIRKKWMKSKRLSVVDDWQDDYILDFTNAKVYPVTFLDLEPVQANADIGRMKALCKLYLFSYFTFNTRDESSRNDFIIPTVIGAESEKSETFTPYTHWKKVEKLHEFLNSPESKYIRPHDYIMFSDATDVFFVNNVKKSKEIFEKYYMKEIAGIDLERDVEKRWPIVFCAEKNRWPPEDFMQNMFSVSILLHILHITTHSRWNYFLKFTPALYQYMHATQKYPFLADCEAKLVYSPFSVCGNVRSDEASEWGCSISDSKHRPFALHSNGGLCPSVCSCLRNMHNSGRLKQFVEKNPSDFAIHSYHVGLKRTRKYELSPVCGKYLNEQYPSSACNK
ncbi:hypothetical protein C9374_014071 [Naegleria lovaniensis]|uniref:Uncharacterized protein n=1 Tax=Naegleria lovaniensis TaxID=51637 RepID=A0AA88H0M0_NAELO|nr:uncharacterized protein C9374_014071 [Naegleria lovaniensis]KAG2389511.1 hypothetical protein C9374_014071 [Naegleria lovaniensis]